MTPFRRLRCRRRRRHFRRRRFSSASLYMLPAAAERYVRLFYAFRRGSLRHAATPAFRQLIQADIFITPRLHFRRHID